MHFSVLAEASQLGAEQVQVLQRGRRMAAAGWAVLQSGLGSCSAAILSSASSNVSLWLLKIALGSLCA